jgi:hypothetical protein
VRATQTNFRDDEIGIAKFVVLHKYDFIKFSQ